MKGVKNFSINKNNNKLPKFLIGAVVILFFLFILNIFVQPVKNFFYGVSAPIQKNFWTAGASSSGFLTSLVQSGSLAQENESLKEQNQGLLSEVASLQSIEQGNRAQSDVSAACQNDGFKTVMAGVVGLDDNDMLSISKGSANGILAGMPVINQQNVLVGKVFKVYKNFSDVMLASNKNSIINVKVQQDGPASGPNNTLPTDSNSEIDGVIRGDGGLNAHLDLIPINSTINAQDVLVTSALEKSFPKDLLVAKIIQTKKDDQKPFQQAQVSLFFDVKTADNLFVIIDYKR